jgi:hypothetical protein
MVPLNKIMTEEEALYSLLATVPVQVQEKLHTRTINIGTEGILHLYSVLSLTETTTSGEPLPALLAIFIALQEDLHITTLHDLPESQEETIALMQEILPKLADIYTAYSMKERNKCALLN